MGAADVVHSYEAGRSAETFFIAGTEKAVEAGDAGGGNQQFGSSSETALNLKKKSITLHYLHGMEEVPEVQGG